MKVFISKSPERCKNLSDLLRSKNAHLHCASLIETFPIPIGDQDWSADWIFFSSRNAVKHFFDQVDPREVVKFGAIGQATADALSRYRQPEFVGKGIDIPEVAQAFAAQVGENNVLFPIGKSSLRSVQQAFDASQITDVVCYETKSKAEEIPSCDVYIFTSPSSVRSFILKNEIDLRAIYLAGPTTCDELRKVGVGDPRTIQDWQESTVIDAIFSPEGG